MSENNTSTLIDTNMPGVEIQLGRDGKALNMSNVREAQRQLPIRVAHRLAAQAQEDEQELVEARWSIIFGAGIQSLQAANFNQPDPNENVA